MPSPIPEFVRTHHTLVTAVCFGWVAAWMGYQWVRRRQNPPFPPVARQTVLFDEQWTSGRSLRSLWTRWGGANRCLRVIVTTDELWVMVHFPFALFAQKSDVEHRIPLSRVANATRDGRSVIVDFERPDGTSGRLALDLSEPEGFFAAINLPDGRGFDVVVP